MSTRVHYQYFEVLKRFVPQSGSLPLEVGRRFSFIPAGDAIHLMCWGHSGTIAVTREEATTFGAIKQLTEAEKRKAGRYIKRRDQASAAATIAGNLASGARQVSRSEADLRAFVQALGEAPPCEQRGSTVEDWVKGLLPKLESESVRLGREKRLIDNERIDNGPAFSDLIAIVDYCRREKPALLQVSA